MAVEIELPPVITRLLAEFCASNKSGTMELHINDGRIVSYKLITAGRVDKSKQ